MPGPARAGLFVYAKDKDRLSCFYQAIASMRSLNETAELTVLESLDMQLLVHRIPPEIAADITIQTPPLRREETALRFFFTVPSLSEARTKAAALGGEIGSENWQGPGFVVCNAVDPEGNIFQVREFSA